MWGAVSFHFPSISFLFIYFHFPLLSVHVSFISFHFSFIFLRFPSNFFHVLSCSFHFLSFALIFPSFPFISFHFAFSFFMSVRVYSNMFLILVASEFLLTFLSKSLQNRDFSAPAPRSVLKAHLPLRNAGRIWVMACPGLLFAIFGYRFVIARVIAFCASWKWNISGSVSFLFHFPVISFRFPFISFNFL